MLHSMGDAGIGWKLRNATEWDEDVTQRVQKLHERIESFFAGGDEFFQLTCLIPPLTLFCSPDTLPYLHICNPAIFFIPTIYSIDVIEIHVPFKDAMVQVQVGGDWKGYDDT